jgi:hypothetical protein
MAATENFYHTATVTLPNQAGTTERIRVPNDESIKALIIETDGALQFTGSLFTRSTGMITIIRPIGAVVQQAYTLINGAVRLSISPLQLISKGVEENITIFNDSGGARNYTIWVIT